MRKLEFIATAYEVRLDIPWAKIGVWTDGIGVYADDDQLCAFPLKKGKRYKVTIEEEL